MFKVAVVGCGGIGRAHAGAWKSAGAEVVYAVDLVEEKAAALAESIGCEYLTDISKLPDSLAAVSVTTPPSAHYKISKQLLERGFNVFCEKPLTLETEEGEELRDIAADKKLVLSVGFKMRFEPIFAEAKKHIGEIGRLMSVVTTKEQAYSPRPESEWIKHTGAMYELSVHDFDLISYITGKSPKSVLYSKVSHRFGWEKEDGFVIAADYGDDVTALLQGMYAVSSTFCYRDLTLTFLGDNGYMRVERPDRIIMHTDKYEVIEVPAAEKSAFVLELTHFMNAVNGIEENTLDAQYAVNMTRFINEAYAKGC